MRKIKNLPLWTSFVAILAMLALVLSCSQVSSGPNVTPSPSPLEPSPSQTVSVSPAASPTFSTTTSPSPSNPTESPAPTELSRVITSDPAKVDNSKLPITSVEELNITGSPPDIDIVNYRLTVDGLVDSPLRLTYEEIMRYPTVTEVVLLICYGVFADNAEWTGVPVTTILAEAGVQPQASEVTFYADRYQVTFSLEEAQGDGVFLAHTVNGQILPKEHGYPIRLVAKGHYGSDWVKWVDRIEIK